MNTFSSHSIPPNQSIYQHSSNCGAGYQLRLKGAFAQARLSLQCPPGWKLTQPPRPSIPGLVFFFLSLFISQHHLKTTGALLWLQLSFPLGLFRPFFLGETAERVGPSFGLQVAKCLGECFAMTACHLLCGYIPCFLAPQTLLHL